MDSRRPTALETNGNNERNGGKSAEDGAFQAHDFGREDLRGDFPKIDSNTGIVHVVGNCTAGEVAPREIAGFGADF